MLLARKVLVCGGQVQTEVSGISSFFLPDMLLPSKVNRIWLTLAYADMPATIYMEMPNLTEAPGIQG